MSLFFSALTYSLRDFSRARLADMLHTAWRRRREYQVAQVDLYSGPAFFWAAGVCALLKCLGKPCVLTLHGGNLPPEVLKKSYLEPLIAETQPSPPAS